MWEKQILKPVYQLRKLIELPTVPYGNAILIHEAIYSVDNIYFYFIDLVICIHSQLPEKWSWFDHDSASEDLLFLKSPQMESEFFNLRHIKVLLQKNIGLLSAETLSCVNYYALN